MACIAVSWAGQGWTNGLGTVTSLSLQYCLLMPISLKRLYASAQKWGGCLAATYEIKVQWLGPQMRALFV